VTAGEERVQIDVEYDFDILFHQKPFICGLVCCIMQEITR
jgi:hypothetical protein